MMTGNTVTKVLDPVMSQLSVNMWNMYHIAECEVPKFEEFSRHGKLPNDSRVIKLVHWKLGKSNLRSIMSEFSSQDMC